MKLIVVSDNHGDTYYMDEILSIHQEDTDGWFHCGDSELPAAHPLFQRYKTVRGNMDFDSELKASQTVEIGGEPFLLAHGHLHDVKQSYKKLKDEAVSKGIRFVFYGHTHIPKVEKEGTLFFANPGSIAQPRDRKIGTYLVVEFPDTKDAVSFTFYDRNHNKLSELSQTFSLS